MKTEMKKIFYFFSAVALGLAAASCSEDFNVQPTFDDADAFVEIGKTSISVAEDGGIISIPVTLASLSGIEETVSYAAVDGTAKEGTDFELVDGAATLKFTADARTQNIQVKIINREGEYTGDLKFTIELKSAGSLNLGMNKSCSVYITDNDHPLASILGTYSATSLSYSNSPQSWTLHFEKDPDDPTIVHIDAITPGCLDFTSWGDWSVTGSVSEDLNTITLGAGQTCAAIYDGASGAASDHMQLITWEDGENGIYVYDTEDVILTQTSPGVWECNQNLWMWGIESNELYTNWCVRAPMTLTKQ